MELNHTRLIMHKSSILFFILSICIVTAGCYTEYEKAVRQGLKSGEVHEELIFDMVMGQTQKEFYSTCWNLNAEKKISQGGGNRYAKYVMAPGEVFEEPEEIEMLFYGIFDEEKIMRGMDMRFNYTKWSPWNEDFHSDKLIERLKNHYMHKYGGNDFITFDSGIQDHLSLIKIDGNRQILMYQLGNKDVSVKIEDLRHKSLTSKKKA